MEITTLMAAMEALKNLGQSGGGSGGGSGGANFTQAQQNAFKEKLQDMGSQDVQHHAMMPSNAQFVPMQDSTPKMPPLATETPNGLFQLLQNMYGR